jgi:hypothetical protein
MDRSLTFIGMLVFLIVHKSLYSGYMGNQHEITSSRKKNKLTTKARAALVRRLSGIFARDDGRNLTQEILDDRRKEAEHKDWLVIIRQNHTNV